MTGKAGKNRDDYKKVNRGLVLKMVATGQCASRAELVENTGLSKMTISNIVAEMLYQGLLAECGETQNGDPRRKRIRLEISPKAPKVIGLGILRDRCEAVLCSFDMKVLRREKIIHGGNMSEEVLVHHVYQLIDTLLHEEPGVLSIGIASIGPLNIRAGRILKPNYFYGIENVEIVKIISERYHLPVYFNNDNQSAVLMEHLFGNGRGYSDILLVRIGEGVGCGVLSSEHPDINSRSLLPELGHVSIDYAGKPCICGRKGCLETYVRTSELLDRLYEKTGKYYAYETFCKITDDQEVEEVFIDAVEKTAGAIVSTLNILNSELILLAGDPIYWNNRYVELLEETINRYRFTKWADRIIVKPVFYGEDVTVMGAACNAVTPVFDGELLFEER
ncbi:MAG: ROK family protein [Lachnospiraceae bacterium]|nr:ROK family protein [Lachnospiraceae bacterium]